QAAGARLILRALRHRNGAPLRTDFLCYTGSRRVLPPIPTPAVLVLGALAAWWASIFFFGPACDWGRRVVALGASFDRRHRKCVSVCHGGISFCSNAEKRAERPSDFFTKHQSRVASQFPFPFSFAA